MLKELWKKWRIARLKAKARRLYIRANGWMDDGYDCGFQLADEISGGRYSAYRHRFDKTMRELRRLDPEAPK